MSTSALSTLSQQQISSLERSRRNQLQQPIQNWKSQIKTDKTQLSSWGKVSGAVSSLNSALSGIKNPSSFNDRKATSSNPNVATASVNKSAQPGRQYNLTQAKQAQSQELYSSGSVSLGSGSGSLTFKFGSSSETVSVSSSSSSNLTFNDVAQAINQKTGGKVSASVVSGSNNQHLVLTGNNTGSSQSFSVTGTNALSGLSYSSGSGNFTKVRSASNASLHVNKVPVTSQSNTFTGAISNGSVTLTGSGSTSISVTVNPSKLSKGLSSVVKKLNNAVSTIHKATKFVKGSSNGSSGSSNNKAGPLLGNYSVTSLGNNLVNAVSGLSNSTLSARDIGLTTNKDGSISFDSSKFASAFKSHPNAVNNLVNQLHNKLSSITQSAIGSVGQGGFISAQKHSLNQSISGLKSEINQQNTFVNQQMQNYVKQFGNLRSTQNNLKVQNSYLSLLNGSGSSKL